jgi:hypothetical protein
VGGSHRNQDHIIAATSKRLSQPRATCCWHDARIRTRKSSALLGVSPIQRSDSAHSARPKYLGVADMGFCLQVPEGFAELPRPGIKMDHGAMWRKTSDFVPQAEYSTMGRDAVRRLIGRRRQLLFHGYYPAYDV